MKKVEVDNKEKDNQPYQPKKKTFSYKFWYKVVKSLYAKREFLGMENVPEEASIYVGNHAQMNGPLVSELYFPLKHLTWMVGEVANRKEFPAYAMKDFWPYKPKSVRWFYNMAAHMLAPLAEWLFSCADVIHLYRDHRIFTTCKTTIKCLNEGYNIIIFPECNDEYNHIVNDFESNYIDLAKMYYNRYKKILKFVPMYNAAKLQKVVFGKPIAYDPNVPIEEQRNTINTYLKEEITRLAQELPVHEVITYNNFGKSHYPKNKPELNTYEQNHPGQVAPKDATASDQVGEAEPTTESQESSGTTNEAKDE